MKGTVESYRLYLLLKVKCSFVKYNKEMDLIDLLEKCPLSEIPTILYCHQEILNDSLHIFCSSNFDGYDLGGGFDLNEYFELNYNGILQVTCRLY